MLRYVEDPTIAALSKGLQGQALRQRVAAGNLANVDTPGYRPRRVEFEGQLRAALQAAEEDGVAGSEVIEAVKPTATTAAALPLRRDGNAVDLETEMVELAESGLHYHTLVRLLSKKLQMLRSVATEGGR